MNLEQLDRFGHNKKHLTYSDGVNMFDYHCKMCVENKEKYQIIKNMPDKSNWEEKFYQQFESNLWKESQWSSGQRSYVSCGNEVKAFIRSLLADRDREIAKGLCQKCKLDNGL